MALEMLDFLMYGSCLFHLICAAVNIILYVCVYVCLYGHYRNWCWSRCNRSGHAIINLPRIMQV